MWAHLLALGLVLLALVPVVGTDAVFSADEGAAAVQAESLSRGDGWIVPHPVPEADPAGENYPLELSERGPKGTAPFAKHPAYILGLAGAAALGGFTGMMLLSLLGTVVAAGLAAAIARRIDPGLVRPTLWVVGLASPLLFDGYIVIAHSLGAAGAAGAVLLAVLAMERRSIPLALAVAPVVALAVLMRNEALFMALALGLTAGAVAAHRRQLTGVVVAGAAVVAGGLTHVLERIWVHQIVGGQVGVGGSVGNGGTGLVAGRARGFVRTWLTASHSGQRQVTLALVIMLVVLIVGALAVRRHPGDSRPIVLMSAIAGAAAVVALLAGPSNLVPGLLFAFPLLAPALLILRRSQLRTTAAQVAVGTSALFTLAVIATQYDRGGTAEWGGRYFALALPVIVPVLLLALRDAARPLDLTARRAATASLVVCSAALAVMAVGTLRHYHRFSSTLVAAVEEAGAETGSAEPVVVTTVPLMPRVAWKTFPDQRWLLVPEGSDLGSLVDRLDAVGVDRFVFVTNDLDADRSGLRATGEVSTVLGPADGSGWQVRVLETR